MVLLKGGCVKSGINAYILKRKKLGTAKLVYTFKFLQGSLDLALSDLNLDKTGICAEFTLGYFWPHNLNYFYPNL